MRISDWSSDVCSSDLPRLIRAAWTLRKRQSDLCSLRPISLRRIFMPNQLSVTRPPRPAAATTQATQHEPASTDQPRAVCPHPGSAPSSFPLLIQLPSTHCHTPPCGGGSNRVAVEEQSPEKEQ